MIILELTSLDDSHILECAVIITDRQLKELERGRWIIHYEEAELDKVSDFHQTTFKSRAYGKCAATGSDCTASPMNYVLLYLHAHL